MSELENILAAGEHKFFYGAMNFWQSVDEVGLKMRKPRYRAMDRYLNHIGPHGRQMMRLSGSIQVNLDFGDSETTEKRWLVTNLMSPIFSAIFGNSPFLEGQATGVKSYRTIIWQNLDKSRTGFPHLRIGKQKIENIIEQYLDFALDAHVFTLPDELGCLVYRQNGVSFQSWLENGYNGFYPSIEDWENHLTTLFPDVRAKGFLECRFMDGQSKPCWAVPAIIATALIYDDEATEKTIALLAPYQGELEKMSLEAATKGVEAFPELCRQVFEIALNTKHYHLDSDLLSYCERFLQHFTHQARNPADDLLDINNGLIFAAEQYSAYEDHLFDIIQPPTYLATKTAKELARGCKC
jgi:glutamate--cysteine ligase